MLKQPLPDPEMKGTRGAMSPRWQKRKPQPPPPNKDQLLAIFEQKYTCKDSGVHLRNFSNTMVQNSLRLTTQRGERTASFLPATPKLPYTPQLKLPSTKRELPSEGAALTGKGRARSEGSFPSPTRG